MNTALQCRQACPRSLPKPRRAHQDQDQGSWELAAFCSLSLLPEKSPRINNAGLEPKDCEAVLPSAKPGMTIQEVVAASGLDVGGDCLVEYVYPHMSDNCFAADNPSQVLLQSTASTKTATRLGPTRNLECSGYGISSLRSFPRREF